MAKAELTMKINIEGALQKELIKVVEKMNKDHGLMIKDIDFHWASEMSGQSRVIRCQVTSDYIA